MSRVRRAGEDSTACWNSEMVRKRNAQRLLGALLAHPDGLTQHALHLQTQLAQGTVSQLLRDLDRVIDVDRRVGGGRSREPKRWSVRAESAYAVGLSVGVGGLSVVMLDAYGRYINETANRHAQISRRTSHRKILDTAVCLMKSVIGTRHRCRNVAAFTVSLPGTVVDGDPKPEAPGAWDRSEVHAEIARMWSAHSLPLPQTVLIERNVDAAARGEALWSAGGELPRKNFLYIHWSLDVSAALVVNSEVWLGTSRRAGELAHLRMSGVTNAREFKPCPTCHREDCLQARINAAALASATGARSPTAFMAAARRGEKHADRALSVAARLLGRAIGPILTVLDLEQAVIGGRVGRELFDLVQTDIEAGARETASLSEGDCTPVVGTKLGHDAAAFGGALWALDTAGLRFLSARLR